MTRGRRNILIGWAIALLASALPVLWFIAGVAERNPLEIYVDPVTGAYKARLYWLFLSWWLRVAVPVSLLALACMFFNRTD